MRVALLNPNGTTQAGAGKLYTTDAFTQVTVSPVYVVADEIEEKNACGTVCVNFKGNDSLKRADVEIIICSHDPELMAMLSGGDVLNVGTPNQDGWAMPAIGALNPDPVSVEVWAKRVEDGDLDEENPYAWWALPKLRNLRFGQKVFNNGASLPSFTGQAYENPNWVDGPLNDWPTTSDRLIQFVPTDELPDLACGATTIAAS